MTLCSFDSDNNTVMTAFIIRRVIVTKKSEIAELKNKKILDEIFI